MMSQITSAILLGLVAMVTAETGYSSGDDRFYQWYEHEPFVLRCEPPEVVNLTTQHVVWETPTKERITQNSNHSIYTVTDNGTIRNSELYITDVTSETSGVYICHIYGSDDSGQSLPVKRELFGINISDKKYRTKFEKYHKNLIVAGTASAVFLVCGSIVVFTHAFSYEVRMEKRQKAHDRNRNHVTNGFANGGHVVETYAYDNFEFSSQL